jgi:polyketide cyclase/dehydrase/lipid transport protein
MRVRNVHQRLLPGPPERVGALIDELASPADRLWPSDRWPAIRLDRPLRPGAEGGHGSIRYRVEAYQPGRRVTFRFTGMPGVDGGHRLEAEPAGEGVVLRHAMELRVGGRMLVTWPLVLRPLHDAMLEDLLDRAELAVTGSVARPARWSVRVRLVRGGSARVRRLRRRLRSRRARSALSGRGGPGYGAGPAPARGTGTGSRYPAGGPGGRAG